MRYAQAPRPFLEGDPWGRWWGRWAGLWTAVLVWKAGVQTQILVTVFLPVCLYVLCMSIMWLDARFTPSVNDSTVALLIRARCACPWLRSTLPLCSQLHKLGYKVPRDKDLGTVAKGWDSHMWQGFSPLASGLKRSLPSKTVKICFLEFSFKFELSLLYEQDGVTIREENELSPGSGLYSLTPHINSLIRALLIV